MRQLLYILFALMLTACNTINHTYNSHQGTFSYTVEEYALVLDSTATNQAFRRDTVPVERIITHQRSPEEIRFKLNKMCTYSFVSNGSDSGPIHRQWKGEFTQNSDTVIVNFTEIRSIGHFTTLHTAAKIEDREWQSMNSIKCTYLFNNKRDTLWTLDRNGKKGFDYIKI